MNRLKRIQGQLWNIAPKNPTQTAYTRFLETPPFEIDTIYTRYMKDINTRLDKILDTRYTKYLERD